MYVHMYQDSKIKREDHWEKQVQAEEFQGGKDSFLLEDWKVSYETGGIGKSSLGKAPFYLRYARWIILELQVNRKIQAKAYSCYIFLPEFQDPLRWPCSWPLTAHGWKHQIDSGKVKVKVIQSCPVLCNPMDYTVHGILQARILEWVAFPFCRGSSQPRDRTQVYHIAGRFFTNWATREAQEYWNG